MRAQSSAPRKARVACSHCSFSAQAARERPSRIAARARRKREGRAAREERERTESFFIVEALARSMAAAAKRSLRMLFLSFRSPSPWALFLCSQTPRPEAELSPREARVHWKEEGGGSRAAAGGGAPSFFFSLFAAGCLFLQSSPLSPPPPDCHAAPFTPRIPARRLRDGHVSPVSEETRSAKATYLC